MARRSIATGIAAAVATVVALLSPTSAQAQTGPEAIERAQSWAKAGVGYSGSNYFTNEYGTYRTDCSGYVSMAWGLSSSYTTVTLPSVSYPIAKDALEPGDILNNPLPGTSGHVVLFAGWADAAQTQYFAYEESPSGGAHLSEIPYPYWPGYGTFIPRRYVGTTSKTAPVTTPEPATPKPSEPEPVADGDFVRHDGKVYRIAGGAPVPVTSWRKLGGREESRKLTDDEFAELAPQVADGTFLRTPRTPAGRGETYVVAGGAPVFVPRGTLKTKDAVTVEQTAIDEPDGYLNRQPADGTIVRTPDDERYVFAGGAPIHVSDNWWKELRPKPSVVTVAQEALDQAGGLNAWSHVRKSPADDTLIKAGADVYRVEAGVPVPHYGVRGVPIDPAAIDHAGGDGPWSHLAAAP
ncbi:MAG: hypothetical protein R2720_00135 [Candidatus Nanopelagicales bacterium]